MRFAIVVAAGLLATAVDGAPLLPSSQPHHPSSSFSSLFSSPSSSFSHNVLLDEVLSSLLLSATERDTEIAALREAATETNAERRRQLGIDSISSNNNNKINSNENEASEGSTGQTFPARIGKLNSPLLNNNNLANYLSSLSSSSSRRSSPLHPSNDEVVEEEAEAAADLQAAMIAAALLADQLTTTPPTASSEARRLSLYARRGRRSTADQRLAEMLFRMNMNLKNQDDDFFGEGEIAAANEPSSSSFSKGVSQRGIDEAEAELEREVEESENLIDERIRRKETDGPMMTMGDRREPRWRGRSRDRKDNKAKNKNKKNQKRNKNKNKNKNNEQVRILENQDRNIDDLF